jgi:predicted transcriptional regulator
MTMMRILQEKGYLVKATQDRAHVYRPANPRQQVIGGMVRDFLDRVFDGASDALLVHLARDNKLTAKQRRIVRQLLDEKESDK